MTLENQKLMNILSLRNSENIWSTFIMELNRIINHLAPTKIVQCHKNFLPYVSEEVVEHIDETNKQLSKAIQTKDTNEWRLYKTMKNQVSKIIEKMKRSYYMGKMKRIRSMWGTIKELAGTKEITTPRTLITGGKQVTSPKEMADTLNEHFTEKIEEIRRKFTRPKMDPIMLLKKLLPRPETKFVLTEISIEETKKYI